MNSHLKASRWCFTSSKKHTVSSPMSLSYSPINAFIYYTLKVDLWVSHILGSNQFMNFKSFTLEHHGVQFQMGFCQEVYDAAT